VKGSRFRNSVIILACVPVAFMFDMNGGLMKLGFVRTTFQEEYKVKPDYLTETVFVAHRQDVPEFKYF
jgi:hypothetical protein